MRIKNRVRFTVGIYNILIGILCIIILVVQRRPERVVIPCLCFVYGINGIINSIETKHQRQKRKEELLEMANKYMFENPEYYFEKGGEEKNGRGQTM